MIKSGSLHHMVKQGQVTGRVNNKPVVTKGGQHVLFSNANYIRPCASVAGNDIFSLKWKYYGPKGDILDD